jgi:hypothetical protein
VDSKFTQAQGSEAEHALSCLQQALDRFCGHRSAQAGWSEATANLPKHKAAKPTTR